MLARTAFGMNDEGLGQHLNLLAHAVCFLAFSDAVSHGD